MEARTISRTMTDVSHLPAAVLEAYRRSRAAEEAAPCDPGSRTLGQRQAITRRSTALLDAIEAAGLDLPQTLCQLCNQPEDVQLSLF